MKGHYINYTKEQLDFIKANSSLLRRETTRLVNEKFGTNYTVANIHALCKRKGWLTGRDGKFKKGQAYNPNSGAKGPNKTSFKKGDKPENHKPIGAERVDKNGYLVRKISDTGIKKNDWVLVHRHVWEKHHGIAAPKNHIVIFVDGDNRNFEPENLLLISRAENAIINKHKLRNVPDELKRVAITQGRLIAKISEVGRAA